jgi:tetratricopeptide (TPR) repeat protein
MHCFVTAIRLAPTAAASHGNLGCLFSSQGKYDKAQSHLLEALNINPVYAEGYCNLGALYRNTGQLIEAEKCYRTAYKSKPLAEALCGLGDVFMDLGDVRCTIFFV